MQSHSTPGKTNTVLTTSAEDSAALAIALEQQSLFIFSLCAAWCGTCTEFQDIFERLAKARPEACFVWLDVEDDAELVEDIEVENFPTLAIYRNGIPLYVGECLPIEMQIIRLIDTLAEIKPTLSTNSQPTLPDLLLEQARLG